MQEKAKLFVIANPGCSKLDLAKHLTRNPLRSPTKQYSLVNAQIRRGYIKAIRRGNRYSLYADKVSLDLIKNNIDPESV
jgi:hypothetical protein